MIFIYIMGKEVISQMIIKNKSKKVSYKPLQFNVIGEKNDDILINTFNIENDNVFKYMLERNVYNYFTKKYFIAMSAEVPENFFELDYDFLKAYNEYKDFINYK